MRGSSGNRTRRPSRSRWSCRSGPSPGTGRQSPDPGHRTPRRHASGHWRRPANRPAPPALDGVSASPRDSCSASPGAGPPAGSDDSIRGGKRGQVTQTFRSLMIDLDRAHIRASDPAFGGVAEPTEMKGSDGSSTGTTAYWNQGAGDGPRASPFDMGCGRPSRTRPRGSPRHLAGRLPQWRRGSPLSGSRPLSSRRREKLPGPIRVIR